MVLRKNDGISPHIGYQVEVEKGTRPVRHDFLTLIAIVMLVAVGLSI